MACDGGPSGDTFLEAVQATEAGNGSRAGQWQPIERNNRKKGTGANSYFHCLNVLRRNSTLQTLKLLSAHGRNIEIIWPFGVLLLVYGSHATNSFRNNNRMSVLYKTLSTTLLTSHQTPSSGFVCFFPPLAPTSNRGHFQDIALLDNFFSRADFPFFGLHSQMPIVRSSKQSRAWCTHASHV